MSADVPRPTLPDDVDPEAVIHEWRPPVDPDPEAVIHDLAPEDPTDPEVPLDDEPVPDDEA